MGAEDIFTGTSAKEKADNTDQQQPAAHETAPVPLPTPAPMAPALVESVETPADMADVTELDIPKGHVLVASIDANGNEIPGSEFTVAYTGYQKRYSDPKKFILKKKPQ